MGYYMAGGPALGLANNPYRLDAVRQAYGNPAVESSRAENLANLLSGARAAGAAPAGGGWVGRVGDMVRQPDDEFFDDSPPRRMNMANPKAVRRAIRRVSSFARAAVKMMPNLRPASRRGKKANPFARKRRRK
jgi:hypothetical protein